MISRVLIIILLFLPGVALAGDPGAADLTNEPVHISSTSLEADGSLNSVVFRGDVVAKQSDLVIYSDELKVTFQEDGGVLSQAVATGNVRVVRGDQVAMAERAVYDNVKETIFLEGKPKVKQGDSFLEGSQITIFLREQRSVVHGADGGRVNAVFSPEEKVR